MFKAYMCYNGNKKQYTDVYHFDTREELEDSVFCSGYDILDDDEHDMWVDAGDMDDFSYDDEPSWQELMQDRYPSCEDGTVFDTPSGFQPLFFCRSKMLIVNNHGIKNAIVNNQ